MATIGKDTTGTQANVSANTIIGCKFTAGATGTLSELQLYVAAQSGTANVKVGIYSDVAGVPTALLAESSPVSVGTSISWASFPITLAITVSTVYWLAFLSSSALYYHRAAGGASQSYYRGYLVSQSTFNDPAVPDAYESYAVSIYGNLPTYPYIQQLSDIDSVADVGTHSSFAAQQSAADSVYDTLTEADTDTGTSQLGDTSGSGSSYRTTAANEVRLQVVTAATTGEVASIVFYGRGVSATNAKAIITDSSGNLLTNGVGAAVAVSATAGTKTLTFTAGSRPIVVSGTTYWIGMIWQAAGRVYYDATTGGTCKQDTTNSYTTPTSPTDAGNTTETWRLMYANINNLNYRLALEEEFTEIPYSGITAATLHVTSGAFSSPAETLNVYVWDGDSWESLGAVAASQDNEFDVTAYVLSDLLYIVFVDGTTTNDAVQSTWQIDSVYLEVTSAETYTKTFTLGAYLLKNLTKTFTLGAYLKKNLTKTYTMGAWLALPAGTKEFTFGAWLKRNYTKQFTLGAYLQKNLTKQFTFGAYLKRSYTTEFTFGAYLQKSLTKTFTLGAWLSLPTATKEFTFGGWLQKSQTLSFTFGAWLQATTAPPIIIVPSSSITKRRVKKKPLWLGLVKSYLEMKLKSD